MAEQVSTTVAPDPVALGSKSIEQPDTESETTSGPSGIEGWLLIPFFMLPLSVFEHTNTIFDDNLMVGNYATGIGGAINAIGLGSDMLAMDMELNTVAYNQADGGAGQSHDPDRPARIHRVPPESSPEPSPGPGSCHFTPSKPPPSPFWLGLAGGATTQRNAPVKRM